VTGDPGDKIKFNLDLASEPGLPAPPGTLARLFGSAISDDERERFLQGALEGIVRGAPLHLYGATWRFHVQLILRELDRLRGVVP